MLLPYFFFHFEGKRKGIRKKLVKPAWCSYFFQQCFFVFTAKKNILLLIFFPQRVMVVWQILLVSVATVQAHINSRRDGNVPYCTQMYGYIHRYILLHMICKKDGEKRLYIFCASHGKVAKREKRRGQIIREEINWVGKKFP